MSRQTYSEEQRAEAVRLMQEVGPSEAARQTGIARGTIASWAHRAGMSSGMATVATARATEHRVATIAERKATLAERLMDDAERMRRDLFTMVETIEILSGEPDLVPIKVRRSTGPKDRATTLQAIAKAVETVNLLTGEATQRIEQLGEAAAAPQRAKAEATVLRLAGAA